MYMLTQSGEKFLVQPTSKKKKKIKILQKEGISCVYKIYTVELQQLQEHQLWFHLSMLSPFSKTESETIVQNILQERYILSLLRSIMEQFNFN